MDPAKGREVLALSIFPAAGVPAPRTAFAEVSLTVPGRYDKEYLGLYAVVEDVDRRFLADRFGNDKGMLMRPFQVRSVEHFGDSWERYRSQYRPLSEPTKQSMMPDGVVNNRTPEELADLVAYLQSLTSGDR